MCALARFVMSLSSSAEQTAAVQWMERTLDDSANRRLTLPQAFLGIDAVLILYRNVAEGLVVYPQVIARRLEAELPFMATESILMAGVAAGGDRQDLHERIRVHSHDAARQVKEFGRDNDLIERLSRDPAFAKVKLDDVLNSAAIRRPRPGAGRRVCQRHRRSDPPQIPGSGGMRQRRIARLTVGGLVVRRRRRDHLRLPILFVMIRLPGCTQQKRECLAKSPSACGPGKHGESPLLHR